ncbi:lipopolysaccharide biosynthesis protein [Microlunatus ginsengisoli]|uniref:Membrane protein involved in the export of O-antigen and teichoic acid n=1 Tax=Microlunatus ginsengisoli TaxID=363863 RepID=A0ABP6ZIJ3_9ACTN
MADDTATLSRRSLRLRTRPVLIGNCGYALAQFAILVVLARILGPTEVGLYALALAVTAPVQLGLGLRLRTTLSVDHSATSFSTYTRLSTALAVLALLVGSLIGCLVRPEPAFVVVVVLVAASKAVESVLDVCYGEYQRREILAAIAFSQLLRGAVTLVLVSAAAWLWGLQAALIALAVTWTLQLLLLDYPRASAADSRSTAAGPALRARDLVRRSWPLGLAAALSSLSFAVPRLTVAGLLDADALGVFAILAYPMTVVTILANSLGQANVRSLSVAVRHHGSKELVISMLRMSVVIWGLGFLGAVGAVVCGPQVAHWLLGDAVPVSVGLLLLLVAGATAAGLATIASYAVVSTTRFGWQPVVVCASIAVTLPVMYLATKAFGLTGTALGIVVMYVLQTVFGTVAALWSLRSARSVDEGAAV